MDWQARRSDGWPVEVGSGGARQRRPGTSQHDEVRRDPDWNDATEIGVAGAELSGMLRCVLKSKGKAGEARYGIVMLGEDGEARS